ncbi:hypothetical protein SAMN02910315_00875 [Methanobrevibacter millerae]|uniref:Uncharacterized protein n=1 Tax=Methanobrevibacter millerae TaxID=230361 RepID=A0A1G5VSR3_9EURY|nr:hypothetical protein SAMN02910315_00875 [Methanobrevibacter millerae]
MIILISNHSENKYLPKFYTQKIMHLQKVTLVEHGFKTKEIKSIYANLEDKNIKIGM